MQDTKEKETAVQLKLADAIVTKTLAAAEALTAEVQAKQIAAGESEDACEEVLLLQSAVKAKSQAIVQQEKGAEEALELARTLEFDAMLEKEVARKKANEVELEVA